MHVTEANVTAWNFAHFTFEDDVYKSWPPETQPIEFPSDIETLEDRLSIAEPNTPHAVVSVNLTINDRVLSEIPGWVREQNPPGVLVSATYFRGQTRTEMTILTPWMSALGEMLTSDPSKRRSLWY
jgi:hypothetical protein